MPLPTLCSIENSYLPNFLVDRFSELGGLGWRGTVVEVSLRDFLGLVGSWGLVWVGWLFSESSNINCLLFKWEEWKIKNNQSKKEEFSLTFLRFIMFFEMDLFH